MELKREAEVEVKESFRLDVINYPLLYLSLHRQVHFFCDVYMYKCIYFPMYHTKVFTHIRSHHTLEPTG